MFVFLLIDGGMLSIYPQGGMFASDSAAAAAADTGAFMNHTSVDAA